MSLSVSMKVIDADKAIKAFETFIGEMKGATKSTLLKAGAEIEQDIKLSMKEGGNLGRIGPRGGRIRIHSREGQAPFVQSGNLRASIGYKLVSTFAEEAVEVGAIRRGKKGKEVPYARKLEEEMNRPYLMPAVAKYFNKFPKALRDVFRIFRR